MMPIAAFIAFAALQGQAPAIPAPTAVVATVGGLPITAAEVEPYLWAWKSHDVINELAGHKMIAAEAAKLGITATDEEVKKRIDEQLASFKTQLQPGQSLDDLVNSQAGGPTRLALISKSTVLLDKISEKEFKPDAFVKVSTIIFRTAQGDSTDVIAKAAKAADLAYAQLQKGSAWDTVLRQNETDARVIQMGGTMGWKMVAAFPDDIQKQFGAMKVTGFTKPVQTPYGIQIFRLMGRGTEAKGMELDDLKKQYEQSARRAIIQRLQQTNKVEFKGL